MLLSATNGFEGGDVDGLAWSPDGRHLAVAHAGGRANGVSIFDAETLQRCAFFEGAQGIGLGYSPDGRTIASGTADGVVLIDPATGQRRLLAALARLRALAFEPTGKQLVTVSRWGEVTLVEIATGRTYTLPRPEEDVTAYSVAFSPDATLVVAGLDDGRVLRWSVDTRSALPPLVGHGAAVMSVAFSPDGSLLASGAHDSKVRLWNPRTGELRSVLNPDTTAVVACVSWSPDGRQLVSTEAYGATLWDVASEQIVAEIPSIRVGSVGVSGLTQWRPGTRTLASRGWGGVTVHDLETGIDRTIGPHTTAATAVAYDTRGESLWVGFADGALVRWDLATGRIAERRVGDDHPVRSIAPVLDGTALVVHYGGSSVVSIDRRTGLSSAIVGPEPPADCAAVSPDGRRLVTGGPERMIRVWDLADGTVRTLGSHEGSVSCVAWSGDGGVIYTGSETVRVWSLASGDWHEAHCGGYLVSHLAASPTEPLFARTQWENVLLTRSPGLEVVAELRADDGSVTALAFSPDGRALAYGSAGGFLRVYAVDTGVLRDTGRVHAGAVTSLAFSPDGTSLITATDDGTIREWDARTLERRFALRAVDGGGSYVFTEGPDARVEIFGDATRACLQAADGHRRVPIDEAPELVVEGLVRRARGR